MASSTSDIASIIMRLVGIATTLERNCQLKFTVMMY